MSDYLSYIGGALGAVTVTAVAAAAASVYAITARPAAFYIRPPVDMGNQSEEIPGAGHARRSRIWKRDSFIEYLYEDAKTLYDVLHRGAKVSDNGPCMGWRNDYSEEYRWLTYNQVLERVKNFGSGLLKLGLKPGSSTFIGIYAQNSVEWVITEHACYHYSMVIVPLYDTLGPNACTFIINHVEITTVICDNEERLSALLAEASQTPSLKDLIVMGQVSEESKALAEKCHINIRHFADVEELGKSNPSDVMPPKPSDLATICYTSGTTGCPKGVMLTHKNIMSNVCSVMYQLGDQAPCGDDVMLSFLPLAHMFERSCQAAVYMVGGQIGFYGGDVRRLAEDMKALRPTVCPMVPRLLNRIYDKVSSNVASSKVKSWLLNMALKSKQHDIERGIYRTNTWWDWLVFHTIQEGVGGRLRLIVVGSAPLASHVLKFIRCALGSLVVEGYGQTECVGPCTLTFQGDYHVEHVGPPLACCIVKLVDVPEMEYYASEGKGEVCVKGPSVCSGYYKEPEKTESAIDSDGWLHTGDIGMWLSDGTLKIVDRKKNIFKLAQGEYIVPERIEGIYIHSPFVSQVFIHGESVKSCLVGIVVPDGDYTTLWCKERNIEGTLEELCTNKVLKSAILEDLTNLGKKDGLKSFEQVKDIFLYPEPFSIDNGLLTPTMKTKRPECRKFFWTQIEAMYRVLG